MPSVLVVENNHDIRTMYVAGLDGFGYEVKATDSIETAKDILRGGFDPAVILLDLDLNDGSGLDLVKFVRNELCRPDIRIIIATGMRLSPEQAIATGADLVLTKPIELINLLNRVQAYSA